MKLYMKQRVFSWGDQFHIVDENGNARYSVQGEVFTFGKKLHIFDYAENEVAFIQQKVFSFLPKYYILRGDAVIAQIIKEFTFFKHVYTVEGLGWTVRGDFFAHDYEVLQGNRTIVRVSKHWFTWGDSYEIDIANGVDEVNALAVVLVIDACLSAQNAAASN